MNPSYLRIHLPFHEATSRMIQWLGKPFLEPPQQVDILDSIKLACDTSGNWRGAALFVYESGDWTVFEDLSGILSLLPSSDWLLLAQSDSLFFAGYNDAIAYAELHFIEGGAVIREFLELAESPEVNVNHGVLSSEASDPIASWVDVAAIVDDDELVSSPQGWLWLF